MGVFNLRGIVNGHWRLLTALVAAVGCLAGLTGVATASTQVRYCEGYTVGSGGQCYGWPGNIDTNLAQTISGTNGISICVTVDNYPAYTPAFPWSCGSGVAGGVYSGYYGSPVLLNNSAGTEQVTAVAGYQ